MLVGKVCQELEDTQNELTEQYDRECDKVHALEIRVAFLERCRDEKDEYYHKERENYRQALAQEREKTRKIVNFLKENRHTDPAGCGKLLWKLQSFWHEESGEMLL